MYLGQRYRSTLTAVSLSIIYCLVMMTGIIGNVTTCLVIARNSYMHTATNYYLFSLAISDMVLLVFGKQLTRLLKLMSTIYRAIICIARTMPSQDVCLSVRPSVTRRYSVETVKHIFIVFSR